jgi:hypothetical protein
VNYFNSTFSIKPGASKLNRSRMQRSTKPIKRAGKLRPVRKTMLGSDARIKQDLTIVLSVYVRLRDPICIVCQNADSAHAGHLWHRDMPSVEFDPRNVYGICGPCNAAHETQPAPMRDAVLARLGERAFNDLETLAHDSTMKLKRIELELLLSELVEKVEGQTGKKLKISKIQKVR